MNEKIANSKTKKFIGKRNRRKSETNPRVLGINPRAEKVNPNLVASKKVALKQIESLIMTIKTAYAAGATLSIKKMKVATQQLELIKEKINEICRVVK